MNSPHTITPGRVHSQAHDLQDSTPERHRYHGQDGAESDEKPRPTGQGSGTVGLMHILVHPTANFPIG